MNQYVTALKSAPSTIYCRLRAYERFIHFLRMQLPHFLPSSDRLRGIESLLTHLKVALGKDRHLRSKITMASSRDRMPQSFRVLREWRGKRTCADVTKYFALFPDETNQLYESLYLQLRNYLIVEYVANHKTGSIQPAIIYLEAQIFEYLLAFVNHVLPLLPATLQARCEKTSHVFQTWISIKLRTCTVSHWFRAGLLLFGINDPHGRPTEYRKAASTLISMHNPLMQESLSQFMCHARSTTERHYRHHMSHKSLWPVFNELARCQNLPSEEDTMTAAPMLQHDLSPENVSISPNSTETPTVFNAARDDCVHLSDSDHEDQKTSTSDGELETSLVSQFHASLDASFIDSKGSDSISTSDDGRTKSVSNLQNHPAIFACKRNGKSIFVKQNQENIFFSTKQVLLEDALHRRPVTSQKVLQLACNSEQFLPLWQNLIVQFGESLTLKKVTDKIRTFARNNRLKF